MKNIQNTLDEMKATLKTLLELGKCHEIQSAIAEVGNWSYREKR